jgi:hypothetical protein
MATPRSARLNEGGGLGFTSTTASGQSAAFSSTATIIRVVATAAVQVRIGSNPTAVTTDTALAPNVVEYFTVTPGQKLAAIGAGTVSITEVS